MSNILIFDKIPHKSSNYLKLTPFLSLKEFQCHCRYLECTRTFILDDTVRSFTRLRLAYGKPLQVNSAYRCQKHNYDIGGRSKSFHKIGGAMDLCPVGDFSPSDLDKIEKLAFDHFEVVLRYESFIHVHNKGAMNEEDGYLVETELN